MYFYIFMLNSPDIQPQNPRELLQKYSRPPNEKDLKWISAGTKVIEAKYFFKKTSNGYKEEIKYPFDYKNVPEIPNGITKEDIVYETPCFLDGVMFHVVGKGADFYQGVMMGRVALVKNGYSVVIWDQQGETRIIKGDELSKKVAVEIMINDHLKAIDLLEDNVAKANRHEQLMNDIFTSYPPVAKAIDGFSKGKNSLDQIALDIKTTFNS